MTVRNRVTREESLGARTDDMEGEILYGLADVLQLREKEYSIDAISMQGVQFDNQTPGPDGYYTAQIIRIIEHDPDLPMDPVVGMIFMHGQHRAVLCTDEDLGQAIADHMAFVTRAHGHESNMSRHDHREHE